MHVAMEACSYWVWYILVLEVNGPPRTCYQLPKFKPLLLLLYMLPMLAVHKNNDADCDADGDGAVHCSPRYWDLPDTCLQDVQTIK